MTNVVKTEGSTEAISSVVILFVEAAGAIPNAITVRQKGIHQLTTDDL